MFSPDSSSELFYSKLERFVILSCDVLSSGHQKLRLVLNNNICFGYLSDDVLVIGGDVLRD